MAEKVFEKKEYWIFSDELGNGSATLLLQLPNIIFTRYNTLIFEMKADQTGKSYGNRKRKTLINVLMFYRVGFKKGLEINLVSQEADFYTFADFIFKPMPYKFETKKGYIYFQPEGKVENESKISWANPRIISGFRLEDFPFSGRVLTLARYVLEAETQPPNPE